VLGSRVAIGPLFGFVDALRRVAADPSAWPARLLSLVARDDVLHH
jgi:hypothetical protein